MVEEVVVVVAAKVSFLVVDDHLHHPRTLRIYNALVVVSTFYLLLDIVPSIQLKHEKMSGMRRLGKSRHVIFRLHHSIVVGIFFFFVSCWMLFNCLQTLRVV